MYMSNQPFFDEETVEKIREHDKEQFEINKKKANFNKINTAADSYSKYSYENEELLKTFVGDEKKYVKFMTKNFNVWAFFFSAFYMLYRKMYLYGFLLSLFLSIVSNYFLQINMTLLTGIMVLAFCLIMGLMVGFSFNRLYIGSCINEINRLKTEYPTLDTKELCRKQGGKSFFLALIAIFIINLLVGIIMRFIV